MTITQVSSVKLLESLIPIHPNLSMDAPAFWIKNISYSLHKDSDQSQREIQYLLIDHQHNVDTGEVYVRIVRKVLTGGVEKASSFNIDFDPVYESIILHECVIYRDGQQINPLLPGNARILQRELSLERHILDGSLSLIMIFSNVKIGDVIDFSYTRKGRNPVYAGYFNIIECVSYPDKIEKFAFRCIRNADKTLHFKIFKASCELVTKTIDYSQIETSYVVEPCQIVENFNTPSWYMSHEILQVSDFQSWQQVSEWGKNLFQSNNQVEIDEVKNLVNEWKNEGKETKIALVTAALDFVQNEIRYLGMEDGIYSHQPHAPQITLSNRYGDCKDKTALLKVFMDEIQVVSTPTLVNTNHMSQVKDFLPSANIFNHVILHVKIDDEFYWLDATQKYEGGSLKDQSKLFYGTYLLLNGEEKCLINNSAIFNPYETEVESHYTFNSNQCELIIKTTFMQSRANYFRSVIAYHGKEGLEKQYLDFFSSKFGSVRIDKPMSLIDDLKKNCIKIVENYTISDLNNENNKFYIPLYVLPEYLPGQVSLSRSEPISLAYPIRISESFRISSKETHQQVKDSLNLKHPSFIFDYQTYQEGNDIVGKYLYDSCTDHIMPEDFSSLRNISTKMHEQICHSYTFKNGNDSKKINEYLSTVFTLKFSKKLFYAIFLIYCAFKIYSRYF
jgi:hypothetical protein